jgi:membrane protein
VGRVIAFGFIVALFFGLYKYLPFRHIRWQMALIGSFFTGIAFEFAKTVFTLYVSNFHPGSFYTRTIAALVITILWVYYAGLVFILGGEVAQVYELRRMRKLQQLAFED